VQNRCYLLICFDGVSSRIIPDAALFLSIVQWITTVLAPEADYLGRAIVKPNSTEDPNRKK